MEKKNERPDSKKYEKEEPKPGKSHDVTDAASDTSISSLSAKVKKFDIKNFVDCPYPEKLTKLKKKKDVSTLTLTDLTRK